MEEAAKSAEEVGLIKAIEAKVELESFVKSKEWGMVLAFIESQSQKRVSAVMTRHKPEASDDEPSQDYVRGEWNGLNILRKFIEEQVGVAKEAVELYKQAVSEQGEE